MQIFHRVPALIDVVLKEITIFKFQIDVRPHLINVRLYLARVPQSERKMFISS